MATNINKVKLKVGDWILLVRDHIIYEVVRNDGYYCIEGRVDLDSKTRIISYHIGRTFALDQQDLIEIVNNAKILYGEKDVDKL